MLTPFDYCAMSLLSSSHWSTIHVYEKYNSRYLLAIFGWNRALSYSKGVVLQFIVENSTSCDEQENSVPRPKHVWHICSYRYFSVFLFYLIHGINMDM